MIGLLASTIAYSAYATQQAESKKFPSSQTESVEQQIPAVVPAEAIALGQKMDGLAAPSFQKWARAYAKKELLKRPAPAEEAVQKTFDARYPNAAPAARTAGIFFAWYLAHQEAMKSEESASRRVEDSDRDIRSLDEALQRVRNTSYPISAANQARDAQMRAEERLESALRERESQKRALDELKERADDCLRRLATLHEQVKGSDPAVTRELK